MKKKRSLFFILLIVILPNIHAQSSWESIALRADSLKALQRYEDAIKLYNQTLDLIPEGDINARHKYYIKLGLSYFMGEDNQCANECYSRVLNETSLDSLNIYRAHAYNNLGLLYDNQGNSNQSIIFYKKALSAYQKINDEFLCDLVHMNIGVVLKKQGDYREALNYFTHALQGFSKRGNKLQLAEVYNSVAGIEYDLGDQLKANTYYKKSLSIREEINDYYGQLSVLNNIGIMYMNVHQYDSALYNFQKSIELSSQTSNRNSGQIYQNIGQVFYMKGDSKKGYKYYNKALEQKSLIGDTAEVIITTQKIAEIELSQKKYAKAYQTIQQAKVLLEHSPNEKYLKENYDLLQQYYEATHELDSALFYLKESHSLSSQINNKVYQQELAQMKELYEAYQRDHQIQLLTEKTDDQTKKIKATNDELEILYKLLIAAMVLALVFMVVVFVMKKLEKIKLMKSRIIGVEQERKRLSRELHDLAGAQLRGMKMDLKHLKSKGYDQNIRSVFHDIYNKIASISDSIVSISYELSLPFFDQTVFSLFIEDFLYDWFENKPTNFSLEIQTDQLNHIGNDKKIHTYRYILESLANIERHTNATNVNLRVAVKGKKIVFTISDNGVAPQKNNKPGMGHRNLFERAKQLGGEFEFVYSPQGSKSIFSIPL